MPETTITYNGQSISVSEQTAPVRVSYNGAQIASIAAGGSKTLNCNGKVMLSNVSVGGKTLNCNGKLMLSNVVIQVRNSAVSVSCTGYGNASRCYATINGQKRYGTYSGAIQPGATITFGIWGSRNTDGTLRIDRKLILTKRNGSATYEWTVPEVSSIVIEFDYDSSTSNGYGAVTVTTAT